MNLLAREGSMQIQKVHPNVKSKGLMDTNTRFINEQTKINPHKNNQIQKPIVANKGIAVDRKA